MVLTEHKDWDSCVHWPALKQTAMTSPPKTVKRTLEAPSMKHSQLQHLNKLKTRYKLQTHKSDSKQFQRGEVMTSHYLELCLQSKLKFPFPLGFLSENECYRF